MTGAYFREVENNRAEALKARENRRAETQKARDKEQDRRTARLKALEDFRQDLINTYHEIKKLRRTLRASSYPAPDGQAYLCGREVFERLMDQMEDMQLRMECLKEEVEARHDIFGGEATELHAHLKESEKYLRELLRSYVDQYDARRNLGPTHPIQLSLPLSEFIQKSEKARPETKEFFGLTSKIRKSIASLMQQCMSQEVAT